MCISSFSKLQAYLSLRHILTYIYISHKYPTFRRPKMKFDRSSMWSICESKSVVNCFCWLSFIEACLLLCLVLFVSSLSLKICGNPKSVSGMLFLLLLVARRYHKLGILSIDLWSGHGSSKLRYTTHSGLKALIWTQVVLWISAWKHPWLPSPSTYFSELWTCTLWFVSLEVMVEDGPWRGKRCDLCRI